MDNRKGTFIYSTLRPISSGDTYPVTFSNENKGGLHSYSTLTERDNISASRRQEGMFVYVTGTTYQLSGGTGNSNWTTIGTKAKNSLTGNGIFNGIDSNGNYLFKSLVAGSNVTITPVGDTLSISTSGSTAVNLSNDPYDYSVWSLDSSTGATRQAIANKFNSVDANINSLSGTTASNGLTKVGNDIKLGGSLIENTTISGGTGSTFDLILGDYSGNKFSNLAISTKNSIFLNAEDSLLSTVFNSLSSDTSTTITQTNEYIELVSNYLFTGSYGKLSLKKDIVSLGYNTPNNIYFNQYGFSLTSNILGNSGYMSFSSFYDGLLFNTNASFNSNYATLRTNLLTAIRTHDFPNKNGILALTSDISGLTSSNGLTLLSGDTKLGGTLIEDTLITGGNKNLVIGGGVTQLNNFETYASNHVYFFGDNRIFTVSTNSGTDDETYMSQDPTDYKIKSFNKITMEASELLINYTAGLQFTKGLITGNNGTFGLNFNGFYFGSNSASSGNTYIANFLTNTMGANQSFTLPSSSGTLALTSDLAGYLPLSGGTITTNQIGFGSVLNTLTSDSNFVWNNTLKALIVGGGSQIDVATPITLNTNTNSYTSYGIKNASSGTSASGDFTAIRNDGSYSSNFVSFGVNSSAYNDPSYPIQTPGSGYAFVNGGDMVIGTQTVHNLIFHTGGTTLSDRALVIKSSGSEKGYVGFLEGNSNNPTLLGKVHIINETDTVGTFFADRYSNSATFSPVLNIRRSRGTFMSPSALVSGDTIGGVGFRGYGTTAFSTLSRALVTAKSTENWTDSAQGTSLTLVTTPVGTASAVDCLILTNTTLTLPSVTTFNINGVSPTISTTSTGTLTLFNTGVTGVTAFGAATAIAIGNSAAVTTLNGVTLSLPQATMLNMNGVSPTMASTSTGTLTLFNTNLLAVNAFGVATTIILGAVSGTMTLRNPTIVGSQTTQALFNTVATTVNFAGAATTMILGGTSTAAITYTLGGNATASATIKAINIGTAGANGSTTNIALGSSVAGSASVITNQGRLVWGIPVRTSTSAPILQVITPLDTTLTLSTESILSQFGGTSAQATVIRQWATGALALQRENLFVAPTYSFVGASTLTTAATVAIGGSPILGTNATITNRLSLFVQSGNASFAGLNGFGNILLPTAYVDADSATTTQASLRLRQTTTANIPTTPNTGDMYHQDINALMFVAGNSTNILREKLSGTIFTQSTNRNVSGFTAETAIISASDGVAPTNNLTIPANFAASGTTKLRCKIRGFYNVTGTPDLTIRVNLGGNLILTTLPQTQTAVTSKSFEIDFDLTYITVGASGTVRGQGLFTQFTTAGVVKVWELSPNSGVGVAMTVDTTVASALSVTAIWSVANALNSITTTSTTLQVL